MRRFAPEELTRRRAETQGAAGRAWLAGLDAMVAELAEAWQIRLGETLPGGSASLVIAAETAAGRAAVLKLVIPGEEARSGELAVLAAAGGRGYAELIRHDPERRVMLLERLGAPLAESGLSTAAQYETICGVLRQAWEVPADGLELPDGAAKARSLAAFIEGRWDRLGRPVAEPTIARALAYAAERERAHRPERAVLGHGDAHEYNTLAAPDGGWKFVDPDGLLIEPEYDLGVVLRGWNAGVVDNPGLGRARAERLAALAGADPEAVWQWGFVERITTGLTLVELAAPDAEGYLRAADALVEAAP